LIDQAERRSRQVDGKRENQLLKMAGQNTNLAAVRSNGLNDEPQYKIEIDREKQTHSSLTVSDVNTTSPPRGDPNSSTSLRIVAESKKCLSKAATTREWFQKTSMTGMFEIVSGKWCRSPRFRRLMDLWIAKTRAIQWQPVG